MAAQKDKKNKLLVLFCALLLTSCGLGDSNIAQPTTGRPPEVAQIPDKNKSVRGDQDPPVVVLKLGRALKERRLARTEPLPANIIVPPTNLTAVPVAEALEAILDGTDVSLTWDAQSWSDHLVTVTNLSGPLPNVVEKLCGAARIFCTYNHGLLELKEKETYVIELPALPPEVSADSDGGEVQKDTSKSAANTMADAIQTLSADDNLLIDTNGGNLIYTTDMNGMEAVHEYLDQLRNGRPLIVVQVHVWEVTLDKDNAAGINWENLSIPEIGGNWESVLLSASSGYTDVDSAGLTIGATLSGKVSSDAVLEFLATQGSVQTISSPQLTFVSGSGATFRVGGKQSYVSEIGLSSSVSGSSSTTTTTSSTVTTDDIETGLTIAVAGSYESGVVVANLQMVMQNLVRIDSVSTSDTEIQLPLTTDRSISTMIRVRPGDNLLLAGMVSSSDTNDSEELPLPFGLSVKTYGSDELENTEIVMMFKPSIVLFAEDEDEQKGVRPFKSPYHIGNALTSDIAPVRPGSEGGKPVKRYPNRSEVGQSVMQRGFLDALMKQSSSDAAVSGGQK